MNQIPMARGKSVDDQLIELAAMEISAEEISRRLGGAITPPRVRQRVSDLLTAGDWLTDVQKERALIRILHMNLMAMRGDELNVDNAKLQLQYANVLLDRLDKRQAVTSEQLETYNSNVGRTLGEVVIHALAYMKGALSGEIDSQRWDILVEEAMLSARQAIAAKQVDS
jgi:hypothetical protein